MRHWPLFFRRPVAVILHGPRHFAGFARCHWRMLHGIRVGVAVPASDKKAAFAAVEQALDLIAQLDPRRLRQMQRDVHRVVVGRRRTSFSVIGRACYVDAKELSKSAGIVALSLVHEAVHARFARAGVLSSGRHAARQEVRCNREELEFLDRMETAGWRDLATLRGWLQDTLASEAQRVLAS